MEPKKIISGIKWTSIEFVLNAIFKFSIQFILAKILLPEEFGLVGICMVFIAVSVAASELGMSAALIQKKDDEKVKLFYPTAFWSSIGWGFFLFIIMTCLVAPFASLFYEEPILMKLIPILSINILIKPFGLIPMVVLTRVLNFKKIANIFNISALIAGIISICGAYYGIGVWALVINSILSTGLTIPMLYLSTSWKPTLGWNKEYFKEIFGFGAYSTGTSIFSTLTYNIDNLIIGKMLGTSLLGSYTLSFSLTEQVRQMISTILNKVMYPVFGKNQDDRQKLKIYFLKIINFNSILIYPVMLFLVFFAKDIIGFFGEKWNDAIIPVKILAVAMMVHLLINSFTSLIRGLGKPQLEMKIIIGLTVGVLIPGLYIGILYYGLVGASLAILVNKIVLVIVGFIVLKKEINLSILNIIIAVKSASISLIFTSIIIYVFQYIFNINNIYILSPVFFLSYLLFIYVLERNNIKHLIKTIM